MSPQEAVHKSKPSSDLFSQSWLIRTYVYHCGSKEGAYKEYSPMQSFFKLVWLLSHY